MQTVFSFAHRRTAPKTARGRVVAVDRSINEIGVEENGEVVSVAIDARDAHESLHDIVAHGGCEVALECAHCNGVACALFLMVERAKFDAAVELGALHCEEELITLATNVWRDARLAEDACASTPTSVGECVVPPSWTEQHPVYENQAQSVSWMLGFEADAPKQLVYDGNLKITDTWYVDTEGQCLTTEASPREAALTGGICADGLGCGKTATALLLAQQETKAAPPAGVQHASVGTLFLLPINLLAQWRREVAKFLPGAPALWIAEARDLKRLTLQDLREARMTFTTFEMLRSNQAYQTMIDDALQGRPREKAALGAWARRPGQTAPVLEAVHWHRVVVDEMHQVLDSARDLKVLRLFRYTHLWGLTGTPNLTGDGAQSLYVLLQRDKGHHPSLLARLIQTAVRSGAVAPLGVEADHSVELVKISAEERIAERDANLLPLAEQVRRLTSGSETEDAARLRLKALRVQEGAAERNLKILERASQDLQVELERCAVALPDSTDVASATREACESQARDVMKARDVYARLKRKREAWEARTTHAASRVAELQTSRACAACGCAATLIGPSCLHLSCSSCAAVRHGACPLCEGTLVALGEESGRHPGGSKLKHVGCYLSSLPAGEGALLFVQFRTLLRQTRTFLRSIGLTVHTLDGNTRARAAALASLADGGVMLLCLEDGFAGLHLPEVRHVVFAHAIVGSVDRVRALEQQAVARCLRPGQTNRVIVRSYVCAETEEFELYDTTHV